MSVQDVYRTWERFVEEVGFERGVKEWSKACWEWWWWQRWLEKWMRRWTKTRSVRLTERIWKLIPKTTWCISNSAICDFQWGDGWWARKGWQQTRIENCLLMNRDQFVKIGRSSGRKNFIIVECKTFRPVAKTRNSAVAERPRDWVMTLKSGLEVKVVEKAWIRFPIHIR